MKNDIKKYPFTAIVGQERMKLALILNVINPFLGGVLIRGEKGTAKSTAVRSLADMLPERPQVEGCRFSCSPLQQETLCSECAEKLANQKRLNTISSKMKVIDLPVSATEDRVVGTLDIEYAIKKGEKKFEPGILAQANRNILYVDEVNLLDDHVVDILLDSAAMGINTIEREGISFSHPARFTLVGTMNPEEGDLRPQLLDRFGLVVDVAGENDTAQRVEVIKRRLAYEKEPVAFCCSYAGEQSAVAEKINMAKERLPWVSFEDELLEMAARISIALGVDGHRADIVMIKTAMTIAAFNGKEKAGKDELREAAAYVLPHRMRRKPFDDSQMGTDSIEEMIGRILDSGE